jgi:hypothetical protein
MGGPGSGSLGAEPPFVRGSQPLRRALSVAARAHEGQRGGGGEWPYLRHPVSVAEELHALGAGETVLVAALLHDSVEDSELSVDAVAEQFGPGVAGLVEALTESPVIDDWVARKDALRARVAAAGPDAVLIYVADKLTNLREMRRLYAERGEGAIDLHKAPTLDLRVDAWRADLEMAGRLLGAGGLVAALSGELEALEAARRRRPAPAAS